MSETLRDLVVALSLDASQFDKNIRLVNRQLKEAESEFALAAAGVENFEGTLSGLREKAVYLQKQLEGQNRIVDQYAQKLAKANSDLSEATWQHERLRDKLTAEISERDRLSAQIAEQQERVRRLTDAYGADSDMVDGAEHLLQVYQQRHEEVSEQIKKTSGQVTAQERVVRKVAETIEDTTTNLNNAQAAVKKLTKEVALNTDSWYTHGVAMQNFAERAAGASRTVEQVGSALTRTVTVPLVGLGAAAAKAAIDYESAFAGVRKTVNASEEEFSLLSDSALEMSTRLATSAIDIAAVMAIAGQLGIANEELSSFTETVVRMGMSTNLAGEEGASSMARFANITGMAQNKFINLGSTLVYLGNNLATTESEIMAMAMRIAAAGTQVGLTQPQILGFAAGLSSLGLEAEAGGSAFSKALKQMETAVATGSKSLDDFAKVAGLTRQEFASLWQSDPAKAFQAFIVGLSRMDDEGISAIAMLDEIGISEIRLSDTLLRSANATQVLADAQAGANQAWADGTALLRESDTRLQTTESRMLNLKNSVVQVGIQFGEAMLPQLEEIVGWLGETVGWFAELDESTKRSIVTWGAFAAASGVVIGGVGKVAGAITSTINVVGKFSEAIGKANAAFKTTGSAASWLGTLLGPGGAVVAGVAVSAAAIAGLIALLNRINAAQPDFLMDADDIERLAIDVDRLKADIEVNTSAEITGDVLSLRQKFISILNDGVPETQEIRDSMKADVDAAVGEAYKLIEEAYIAKKTDLDKLFAEGVIDEATYTQSMKELTEQTDAMKGDLESKASAVTTYVAALCAQNRAMTDEEIGTLNDLLESLGMVTQQVEQASDAQMHIYELAKTRTMLGVANEDEQLLALEGIELEHAMKLGELEQQRRALDVLYGEKMTSASMEEQARLNEELEAQRAVIDQQEQMLNQQKMLAYAELMPGMLGSGGIGIEQLEQYLQIIEEYEKKYGSTANPFANWLTSIFDGDFGRQEAADQLRSIQSAIEGSGVLSEESPISVMLATLADQGLIAQDALADWTGVLEVLGQISTAGETAVQSINIGESITAQANDIMPGAAQAVEDTKDEFTNAMTDAAEDAKNVLPDMFDMNSPSKVMYRQGLDVMAGLKNGINAGRNDVVSAMRSAARAAVNAAKSELKINSPSKVFEDDVGAMTMQGFGKGVLKEAENQARIIRNASRYLTDAAQNSVYNANDNRQTYNSSVTLSGNTFIVNDQQDVHSLATEIAVLTQAQQRGRGQK